MAGEKDDPVFLLCRRIYNLGNDSKNVKGIFGYFEGGRP